MRKKLKFSFVTLGLIGHFRQVISKWLKVQLDFYPVVLEVIFDVVPIFGGLNLRWLRYFKQVIMIFSPTMVDKFNLRWFLAIPEDGDFKMFSNHVGLFTMNFIPSWDCSNPAFALSCLEVATGPHCGLERP